MSNFREVGTKIRGPLMPILTAFRENERLDIDSTRKWVDWLLGKGIRLFWTTQGTSHFMTLSDREVVDLTQALAEVISGRGLFIASTPVHGRKLQFMGEVDREKCRLGGERRFSPGAEFLTWALLFQVLSLWFSLRLFLNGNRSRIPNNR